MSASKRAFARVCRQVERERAHAGGFGRPPLVADVDLRRRVVADHDDGKPRRRVPRGDGARRRPRGPRRVSCCGDRLAIEDAGGHSGRATGRIGCRDRACNSSGNPCAARPPRSRGPAIRLRPFVVRDVTAGFVDRRARRAARRASDRPCSTSTRTRVALATGLRDDAPSRSAAMADVARALRSRRRAHRVARRALSPSPPRSAPRRCSSSSAPRRAISASARTPRTSTASCAPTRATSMWLARRSPAKAIDPGMLDNLVGGGIAAGGRCATP